MDDGDRETLKAEVRVLRSELRIAHTQRAAAELTTERLRQENAELLARLADSGSRPAASAETTTPAAC